MDHFIRLRSAENNFNKNKPEFSLQLEVGERSLDILKNLIHQRERNLTVTNPLRIKATESDLTFPSFTPGDAFPATFDGTSTDDDQDGDIIDASRFTAGTVGISQRNGDRDITKTFPWSLMSRHFRKSTTSHQLRAIRRYGSGTLPRAPTSRPSKAIAIGSTQSPSVGIEALEIETYYSYSAIQQGITPIFIDKVEL